MCWKHLCSFSCFGAKAKELPRSGVWAYLFGVRAFFPLLWPLWGSFKWGLVARKPWDQHFALGIRNWSFHLEKAISFIFLNFHHSNCWSLSRVHMDWQNKLPRPGFLTYSEENEDLIVTLETVVSMERDKVVWTSRVKHTCLSDVLISCTDEGGNMSDRWVWPILLNITDKSKTVNTNIYQLWAAGDSSSPSPFPPPDKGYATIC